MPAVSDADVLIHLAKLGRLTLLSVLYGPVRVPACVKGEALPGRYPDEAALSQAFQEGGLVAEETDAARAERLAETHRIDAGEGHVKALAESRRATLVLSNEKRLREAVRAEGFPVVGTLGVLLRAVKAGHLPKEEAEAALRKVASEERVFRIHPAVVARALEELERL